MFHMKGKLNEEEEEKKKKDGAVVMEIGKEAKKRKRRKKKKEKERTSSLSDRLRRGIILSGALVGAIRNINIGLISEK